MNKKWLLGILAAGSLIGAGFVACGSGSIEAPGDLDEMYVDTFVENINGEVDKAIEACESDPMCASGLPSVAPSSSSKKEETPESSSATTEAPASSAATVNPGPTPIVSSSSAVDIPPGAVVQSSSSVDIPPGAVSPIPSSSSAAVTPTPTPSSSSVAVTPSSSSVAVTPSSSSVAVKPSSSSVAVTSSSSAAAPVVDPSGATEIVLNYDGALTELPAGKYALTSTNQWSGSLACEASTPTTVTVDGVEATIGTSLNNVGNAKPTAQNTVILIVPEGATISCKTRW